MASVLKSLTCFFPFKYGHVGKISCLPGLNKQWIKCLAQGQFKIHTCIIKAMLNSRKLKGLPIERPRFIQERLIIIMLNSRSFQGLPRNTIHSSYRQCYIIFKDFSRTSKRNIKVHTGKAMKYSRTFRTAKRYIKVQNFSRTAKIQPLLVQMGKAMMYSRAIQGLPWDTPRSIQTRLCCIQEQFKDCHEIHLAHTDKAMLYSRAIQGAMRYTKVHTDKAMLYSRAIQGLPWDTPGSTQTKLCCIQEQFKDCHEIHQGPYRQGYVVFKSNSRCHELHQGPYRQGYEIFKNF